MALDSMIQVQEQPIILQYTKQGIQGVTGATGPQGRDGDVWELRLTMTGAPDGSLTMELFRNGELCEDQHYASVMYMSNDGAGYEQSDEWSKSFTSTYSFAYQGMRSFFVTIYDDAFMEKVICHNSVNYGKAATMVVGDVQSGGTAQVTNSGTVYDAILDFVLPKGDAATVTIGTTTTLPAGSHATVENVGTANDAILNFGIPNGGGSGARVEENSEGNNIILDAGAIYIPSISTDGVISWTNNASLPNPQSVRISINPRGAWSETASYTRFETVLYNGSTYMALKDVAAGTLPTSAAFWIMLVEKGEMGTVEVGTTTTGEPGTDASVVNSGTNSTAVLDFTIPRGDKGDQGPSGRMTVGTVTTLPEGSDATVTNSGTETNAVWDFGIPRGDTGHFDADFIADYFDTEKNYHVNDYVIYGSYLYRFTDEHPAGAWDDNDAVKIAVTDDLPRKADMRAITAEFEPFKAYNAYDYVMYNGLLYQFITAHGSGLWDENEVTQISYADFDSTADYAVGDYVEHEGVLYQFTSAHSGSDWDTNDVTAAASTAFATGTAYSVGDYVTYNGNLYQFTSAHTDGDWDSSEVSQLTIVPFDTDDAYSVGDYVTYNGALYQFTSVHENGLWDANDVTLIEPTAFDTDTDYSAGDYVTYNGGLYRFTSAHFSGVWDGDFVTEIPFTAFGENTAYAEGDCVTYNNNYYIFNTAHTSGAWNNSEATPIQTREFLNGTNYAVGDYVTYGNGYYRFTTAHPNGAWNEEEVKEITITTFLTGTTYQPDAYVLKDGYYYKFTTAHPDGAWNSSEVRSANAVVFSEDDYYIVGKIVFYEDAYYCFTTTHTAGAWDASQVNEIEASEFDDTENYEIGDYVVYEGDLYFYTSPHTGSGWNDEEVEGIMIRAFNNIDSYSINDYVSDNGTYYQYVTNHDGSAWDSSQVTEIQADDFSATTNYAAGEFVVYSGTLYQFLTAHTGSVWNSNEVTALTVDAFSTANDYAIGDYVLYDSKLWIFNAPKQGGAWRSSEASEIEYDTFDATENYSVGDYVEYNGDVYQFTADHSNGHWDSTQLVEIEYDEFDDTKDYIVGEYVGYNGDVYIFTSAHVGSEWNDTEVTQISYDEFSTLLDYAIGDYVEYNGDVYQFTSAHSGGAFDSTEVTAIEYDSFGDKSYTVGDYVEYEGDIYQFTTAHTGSEWDASEVRELALLDIQTRDNIIGSEFDDTVSYDVGDYVLYKGSMYQFTTAHTAGVWDSSEVTLVTVSGELNTKSDVSHAHDERYYTETESDALLDEKLNLSEIAEEFSDSTSYNIGDLVIYNRHLYKFTAAHSAGEWDGTDAVQVTVGNGLFPFDVKRENTLTANDDLDDLFVGGIYYCLGPDYYPLNLPSDIPSSSRLIITVINGNFPDFDFSIQEIYAVMSGSVVGEWKRRYYTTWGPWCKFLTENGGTVTVQTGGVWVQGGSAAGGNNTRMELTNGMPDRLPFNQSKRGTFLYSNGIAFADPYNGNSNNDSGWIRHIETTANSGTLEIATGDDAAESIVVKQYNGSSAVARQMTLMNGSGILPDIFTITGTDIIFSNVASGAAVSQGGPTISLSGYRPIFFTVIPGAYADYATWQFQYLTISGNNVVTGNMYMKSFYGSTTSFYFKINVLWMRIN